MRAEVWGSPVGHSLSPKLHGYWLERYGIDGEYVAREVTPPMLEPALALLRSGELVGVNLTVPLKEAAIVHLDRVDPEAKKIGAVNLVRRGADGALEGYNTDIYGFTQHLLASAPGLRRERAVVLGAGGAARAVVAGLKELGFAHILVANRTLEKAQALGAVEAVEWERRQEVLEHADLLVNTTVLGMQGQPELEIDLIGLPPQAVVYDLVYAPLETQLLHQARARGLVAVDGLGMLLHQAAPSFAAFFGAQPEVDERTRVAVLE